MKLLRNLFLIFLFIFIFHVLLVSIQENSISREELKIIDMIDDKGLDDSICEWRGLDSDIYLSDNERFDLDKHTSIYKIHCYPGASFGAYKFFTLIKALDEIHPKDDIYLMEFPYPQVLGE